MSFARVLGRGARSFDRVRDTILDAYHDTAMQKQCHNIGRELRSVLHRPVHQQINEMLYDL